jgi:curved DNA-binding protein
MAIMPVEFKDYYGVLGVPRDATDADIKKAFRKLARQYHPDVAKEKKTSEAKFKEINEAYEVLGDPQKRRKYDELGANWDQQQSSAPPPGRGGRSWSAGDGTQYQEFHFGGTGFSDFFEQFFGGRGGAGAGFNFQRGAGAFHPEDFEQHHGPIRGSDIEGDILVTLDEVMNGSTRTLSLQRENPATGKIETQTFKVRIPAGVQEGQSIRVAGLGHPGEGGGAHGDLYLRVRLAAHPDFRARGADIYQDLDVAPWEAVLGASVSVRTLGGGRLKLRIPAGASNGQQLRMRGQGLPKGRTGERGDLYVVITVQLPDVITAEERELWEKLSRTSNFSPRHD